ncbi:sigma-70 family RNA polymerase sigma factor [Phyllobacterium sp. SB3]|uniref:RNA polymerase sigma factor n=1 Tax=Phyllobacterium sp. SB3 TaxID=3156073 RepID=UPI0032AF10FF
MAESDDAFVSAFIQTTPEIKRYLTRMTGSREDSEDLMQEAWIKLARNKAAAIVSPIPYLKSIARSLAIDHDRKRKRLLTSCDIAHILLVRDELPGPEQQLIDRDQIRSLMAIIKTFPERRRRILIAARLERRPYAEIAQEFGVSVRTVELEIRKALDYCIAHL